MTAPVWNSAPAIAQSIAQYKAQLNAAAENINILDQQRAQLVKGCDQLVGAVTALEQLLQNGADEAAASAPQSPVQQGLPMPDTQPPDAQ